MPLNPTDVCFVSVAFGQAYLDQQNRLLESIRSIYPEANTLFFHGRLPDTSRPFLDSLYGFKPHAIQEARKHYRKIIWLDPAMLLVGPIDRLMKFPLIAVRDESKLYQSISEKYLNHLNFTRDEIRELDWHLVGGSFFYFDFNDPLTTMIFECWAQDEYEGFFGSQQEAASEQINSHRYDESCLAANMYVFKVEPKSPQEVGYCVEKDAVFSKIHFK